MGHIKNRFEYYGEKRADGWVWFYRPVGASVYITLPGRKAHLLALLERPAIAVQQYASILAMQADVAKAQDILRGTQLASSRSQAEAFSITARPPAKAARAAREYFASLRAIERARARLERAMALSDQLAAQPFNPELWLANHFGPKA